MPVVILYCACAHAYQDEQYGPGQRVHNTVSAKNGKGRCTVCGATKK